MSKAVEATCSAGVVKVEGIVVDDAEILSDGTGDSTGILIIDGEKSYYVATNSTDLKTAIENISDALSQIATTLTSIGAGMTGATTAPPPGLGTDVTAINSKVTTLNTLKDNLK